MNRAAMRGTHDHKNEKWKKKNAWMQMPWTLNISEMWIYVWSVECEYRHLVDGASDDMQQQ